MPLTGRQNLRAFQIYITAKRIVIEEVVVTSFEIDESVSYTVVRGQNGMY